MVEGGCEVGGLSVCFIACSSLMIYLRLGGCIASQVSGLKICG